MVRLYETSGRLVDFLVTTHFRYLYYRIAWDDRLIMIRGSRGVGKTTMMLQRCRQIGDTALYASLDQLFFNEHTIVDLADYHYKHGGTHLFLDEVHLYPRQNWEQELKNIYDSYPTMHVVFTGSSLLQLNSKIADLSRRIAIYELYGLSFREFLNFSGEVNFSAYTLEELLRDHVSIAREISSQVTVIREFERYLQSGYYPFFLESSGSTYLQRVERTVLTVIDKDIPAVADIEYETQLKLKKLLVVLADQVPFMPNISALGRDIGVSRNQLMKYFTLLGEGKIIRTLASTKSQTKGISKPEKILFDNTSVMQALGIFNKTGTVRECFAASMLSSQGKLAAPPEGDFQLDGKYLFEVGGMKKGFSQIADIPDSYVLADNLESGFGNKLPLWLIGFIY